MSFAVFLRGVNVGGHKAFRPSELARAIADFDVSSIGAAGTFIVHGAVSESVVRSAFAKHLPFQAHLMVCPENELIDLVRNDPFPKRAEPDRFISVLERRPRTLPRLPLRAPAGNDWQVGVVAIRGPFVASILRRIGKNIVYPNEVVEKHFGVAATTRGWPTIVKICTALEKQQ